MPILKNPRHEKFAQIISLGIVGASQAARECGFLSAPHTGWRLMRNDAVLHRIKELKGESASVSSLSRQDVLNFLGDILSLPIKHRDVETKDQLKAAEILLKMCGWNEPEQHDVNFGLQKELVDVIAKLRGRKSNPIEIQEEKTAVIASRSDCSVCPSLPGSGNAENA